MTEYIPHLSVSLGTIATVGAPLLLMGGKKIVTLETRINYLEKQLESEQKDGKNFQNKMLNAMQEISGDLKVIKHKLELNGHRH